MGIAFVVIILCCSGFTTSAHQASDSYLNVALDDKTATARLDILASDLEYVVSLDSNDDGTITVEEMLERREAIDAIARKHLKIKLDGSDMSLQLRDQELVSQQDGIFVSLTYSFPVTGDAVLLEVAYNFFFDINPQHRGLFLLEHLGKQQTAIFTPTKSIQEFKLAEVKPFTRFTQFILEGTWHIWRGYDHILFLLALLLPAVLRRDENQWHGVKEFRGALFLVLKIVTAFTVAHSITLALATFKVVAVPSRFIESIVAASVAVAAANNLKPFFREGAWRVAFVFGLVHGFAFANALGEHGASQGRLVLTLLGFNLGVELGQLAIVAIFLPLAFAVRTSWFYRRAAIAAGSWVIIICASLWMVERMFDLKFMPF